MKRLLAVLTAAVGIVLWRSPRLRLLLRRWFTVGALAGRTTARGALHQVRRAVAQDDERPALDEAFMMRSAEDAAATLGNMKGAFMKVGQLVSFIDDGMPEAVRTALAQLQDSVAPMAPELAAAVIRAELGAAPEDVFREWDPVPLAAASIGQVHRARLADGTPVAVKVQYPGIDQTMAADLSQLDLGRIPLPSVWASLDIGAMTAELKTRLLEELDYTIEADNQRTFASWYADHPFIDIPAVFDDFSTGRVLTTSLAGGARFAALDRWDQRERDLAGEAIFRFVYRSLYDYLAFNGDPHPGNYLFNGGGSVTFLDFGLVKRFSKVERDHEAAIVTATALHPDPRAMRLTAIEAGYFVRDNPLTDAQTSAFMVLLVEHLVDDRPFTVTAEWASRVVRQYLFKGEEFAYVNRWGALPTHGMILQRITVGLLAILGRLNATANWHAITKELLEGAPPVSELGEREAAWLSRQRQP